MAIDWYKTGRSVLVSACALFSLSVAAQLLPEEPLEGEGVIEEARVYSVEIIVFEYASNVTAGNEIFEAIEDEQTESDNAIPVFGDMAAESAVQPDQTETVEFGNFTDVVEEEITELELMPSMSAVNFRLLTAEELTMVGIHERLVTLDAYEPVLWSGWMQSTREKDATPSIQLRALGTPPLHIDGTLTLYLKNYLHLVVDLTREQKIARFQPIIRHEQPSRDNVRSGGNNEYTAADMQTIIYHIQEDRLFQSGQLRYYDHPKFGVLARVNRVEGTAPEDDAEDEDDPSGRSMLSNAE